MVYLIYIMSLYFLCRFNLDKIQAGAPVSYATIKLP